MLICVTFSNLKSHQSHLDYEIEVSNHAVEMIEDNLQQARYDPAISMDLWKHQYQFINQEIQRIKKRKEVLEYIYDTLFEANQQMEQNLRELSKIIRANSVEFS